MKATLRFLSIAIPLMTIFVSCTKMGESMNVMTGIATDISCRNARISGFANLPGTTNNLEIGFLYSTSEEVLIGTATKIEALTILSDGSYSINTEVLEPETTYYYRAYISQSGDIYYGELKSFETLPVSSMIQTLDADKLKPKEAILNAFLDLKYCNYDSLEYGFEVETGDGITHTIKADNLSKEMYSVKDESLQWETSYSFTAYVKLDGRTYKGEKKGFTTQPLQASLTAMLAEIAVYSATIIGKLNVTSEGTFNKSATLYLSSSPKTLEQLKSSGKEEVISLKNDGSFSLKLTNLIPYTRYYFAVVAKVDNAEYHTETTSFITNCLTAESSNISHHTCTISGRYKVTGNTLNQSPKIYYSSTASTLSTLKSSGKAKALTFGANDSYSIELTDLASDTRYYYALMSRVDGVDQNTEVKSFSTAKIQASATAEASNITFYSSTISGKLNITSEGTFNKSAALYFSNSANTLDALKAAGTKNDLTLMDDGSFELELTDLVWDTHYYFAVICKVDDIETATTTNSFKTLELQETVDLGLSVKWRGWNLGATSPVEYGGYYQWAGTQDVSDTNIYLDWSKSPYHTGTDYLTGWTKYVPSDKSSFWSGSGGPDDKTALDAKDDAAHVILGGKWRTPTREEWQELNKNCTFTRTKFYGVYGYKIQSKKPGFTENFIFIPCAGYRDENTLFRASYCYYLSSSVKLEYPDYAYYAGGITGSFSMRDQWMARFAGLSVRPVTD